MALEMIEQQYNLWQAWRREDKDGAPPMARWVTATRDGDLVLHGSPVSAAHVLRKLLWDEVDSVVMTSATLTGGGDFQSLAIDNGIPEEAEMVSLSSPFDLPNQAELIVPKFPVTPDDREGHPREVARYLDTELDWAKGSMVLFTSRWKMEKVAGLMSAARRKQVLVQGEMSKTRLIDEHLRRVAAGEGSVLFGLNSFGEGLDLPGEACTTVVITGAIRGADRSADRHPQRMVRGAWAECLQPDRHSACVAHADPVRRPPDPHFHRHRPRDHPRFAAADPPLRQAHHRRAAAVQARDRLTGSAGRWPEKGDGGN